MSLIRRLKAGRRELVRVLQLQYAKFATRMPEAFPDFMCIGAPRAATTWLYASLRDDSRLFLPKTKEVHFFDEPIETAHQESHGLQWDRPFYFDMSNPSHWRWYALQFRRAGTRLKGDITPVYSTLSRERVGLIGKKLPQLKIIYIIRNPVDRAWSGLRKSLWYQQSKKHAVATDAQWLQRAIMHPEVLKRGHYREAIENWSAAFAPDRLLYLFYDDIVQDEKTELTKVYQFLGLNPHFIVRTADGAERINAAPALKMPNEIRAKLSEYYRPQISYLQSRFSRDLHHWLPDSQTTARP